MNAQHRASAVFFANAGVITMNFGQAVNSYFRKYVTFTGRASRPEYWYAYLFSMILILVATLLDFSMMVEYSAISDGGMAPSFFTSLITLALFFPSLTVGVRRLHDTNRSGWWMLLILVPLAGIIALIVFFCQRGTDGTNRFGD